MNVTRAEVSDIVNLLALVLAVCTAVGACRRSWHRRGKWRWIFARAATAGVLAGSALLDHDLVPGIPAAVFAIATLLHAVKQIGSYFGANRTPTTSDDIIDTGWETRPGPARLRPLSDNAPGSLRGLKTLSAVRPRDRA